MMIEVINCQNKNTMTRLKITNGRCGGNKDDRGDQLIPVEVLHQHWHCSIKRAKLPRWPGNEDCTSSNRVPSNKVNSVRSVHRRVVVRRRASVVAVVGDRQPRYSAVN